MSGGNPRFQWPEGWLPGSREALGAAVSAPVPVAPPDAPPPAKGPPFLYRATVLRWLDGDTVEMWVDVGFGWGGKIKFRLIGSVHPVDAYEMTDKDPTKRHLAREGKARSEALAPPGAVVAVRSELGEKKDGFQRYLAEIVNGNGVSVGDALLAEGLAVVWTNA